MHCLSFFLLFNFVHLNVSFLLFPNFKTTMKSKMIITLDVYSYDSFCFNDINNLPTSPCNVLNQTQEINDTNKMTNITNNMTNMTNNMTHMIHMIHMTNDTNMTNMIHMTKTNDMNLSTPYHSLRNQKIVRKEKEMYKEFYNK